MLARNGQLIRPKLDILHSGPDLILAPVSFSQQNSEY
ncbi:Neural cell adhesion molecule 2-like Protein [Tribolium castaneum]|uniref:Neural cell adhesion molecule 2-like Protein n=1 Tax=Tribolium castaneum TaxID=7070 RepID=A0A139WEB2_TRICA|nr:Neural cell adhesion molecule 2-like Protein [Tribolium castaneum]